MLNEHPRSSFEGGRKGSEHKTTPTKVSFCVSHMWDGKKKDAEYETHPRLCGFRVQQVVGHQKDNRP